MAHTDPLPPLPRLPAAPNGWRHVKTGHTYIAVVVAREERTLAPVVVYARKTVELPGDEPEWWTRPFEEFTDGRFVPL